MTHEPLVFVKHMGKTIQIPLSEVLQMQRVTWAKMNEAASGSANAVNEIEQVMAVAQDDSDKRAQAYATVSLYLLSDACDQLQLLAHQRAEYENNQALVTEGSPVVEGADVVAVAGKCEHEEDATCQYCVKKG